MSGPALAFVVHVVVGALLILFGQATMIGYYALIAPPACANGVPAPVLPPPAQFIIPTPTPVPARPSAPLPRIICGTGPCP